MKTTADLKSYKEHANKEVTDRGCGPPASKVNRFKRFVSSFGNSNHNFYLVNGSFWRIDGTRF